MSNTPELLTKKEAARELRVCQRTIENLMRGRSLSYIKVGRVVRITRAAIKAHLDSHTVEAHE